MKQVSIASKPSSAIAYVLNLLSILALLLSREIKLPFIVAALILATLALAQRYKERVLSNRTDLFRHTGKFILFGLVASVATGLYLVIKTKWHPVDTSANIAIVIASLLIFLEPSARERATRLGYDFLVIVLAAALNPEIEMALILFIFILLSSQQLTLIFIDNQQENYSIKKDVLRKALIFNTVAATITFVLSIGFFPLLPKLKPKVSFGLDLFPNVNPGYTENVDLNQFGKWSGEGNEPVLRISVASLTATNSKANTKGILATALILPYLRGRVLDQFDGKSWLPSRDPLKASTSRANEPSNADSVNLEIIREPLASHSVLVPYGTVRVGIFKNNNNTINYNQTKGRITHDIIALGTQNRRQRYVVEIDKSAIGNNGFYNYDSQNNPSIISRAMDLPPEWRKSNNPTDLAIQTFEATVFKNTHKPLDKIKAIARYFRQGGGYNAELANATADNDKSKHLNLRSNLEEFILHNKVGHCGLFASATAWLLRRQGIPARLISGFAITHNIKADTEHLTIRNRDAHAWVEAWVDNIGWIPVESTPPIRRINGTLGFLNDTLEALSDSWYFTKDKFQRYWFDQILKLGSEEEPQINKTSKDPKTSPFENIKSFILSHWISLIIIMSLILAYAYWWIKVGVASQADPYLDSVPRDLKKLRKRREKIIGQINKKYRPIKRAEETTAVIMAHILRLDEKLRFSDLQNKPDVWSSYIKEYGSLLKQLESRLNSVSPPNLPDLIHSDSLVDPDDRSTRDEKKVP